MCACACACLRVCFRVWNDTVVQFIYKIGLGERKETVGSLLFKDCTYPLTPENIYSRYIPQDIHTSSQSSFINLSIRIFVSDSEKILFFIIKWGIFIWNVPTLPLFLTTTIPRACSFFSKHLSTMNIGVKLKSNCNFKIKWSQETMNFPPISKLSG